MFPSSSSFLEQPKLKGGMVMFALARTSDALAEVLGKIQQAAQTRATYDNEALRLAAKYAEVLRQDFALTNPELRHLAVTHIHDLIAIAVDANRNATSAYGSMRVARLAAIKADILENLNNPDLTLTAVATRQHITPRYIHMLFAMAGITFSEFILGQRLAYAHRMLTDPRFASLRISTIAFEVGFGDLSHFNRTFRKRFGATPSELRHTFTGGGASQPSECDKERWSAVPTALET
jgi:AraC-like DNA-binding protein